MNGRTAARFAQEITLSGRYKLLQQKVVYRFVTNHSSVDKAAPQTCQEPVPWTEHRQTTKITTHDPQNGVEEHPATSTSDRERLAAGLDLMHRSGSQARAWEVRVTHFSPTRTCCISTPTNEKAENEGASTNCECLKRNATMRGTSARPLFQRSPFLLLLPRHLDFRLLNNL